jgi:hypothetical protein
VLENPDIVFPKMILNLDIGAGYSSLNSAWQYFAAALTRKVSASVYTNLSKEIRL